MAFKNNYVLATDKKVFQNRISIFESAEFK